MTEQMRAYRNQDGKKKKQNALPMIVLQQMLEIANSPWEHTAAWLLIGAIFFAMRSCEYLDTKIPEKDRRTKILRLWNIIFKTKGITIPHTSFELESAEIVQIVFKFQKNDK